MVVVRAVGAAVRRRAMTAAVSIRVGRRRQSCVAAVAALSVVVRRACIAALSALRACVAAIAVMIGRACVAALSVLVIGSRRFCVADLMRRRMSWASAAAAAAGTGACAALALIELGEYIYREALRRRPATTDGKEVMS